MNKKIIISIFSIIFLVLIFLPIYCNAITVDELELNSFLSSYNQIKDKLLLILIVLMISNFIISIVVICTNKKKYNCYKYLTLLFETTLIIYFIGIKCVYKIFNNMGTYTTSLSQQIGNILILFACISIVMEFINIKYDSKIKKELFNIFVIIGLISIIGIIICGKISISNAQKESDRWDEFHRNHPGFIGEIYNNEINLII